MASFSGLGIGLSFLFGSLLLGLVAELYYLLWWKKRFASREIEDPQQSNLSTEISYFLCWKKPNPVKGSSRQELHTSANNLVANGHEQDLELGTGKDFLLKNFGEEGVESELMRLHNLCGPPRFLFTIKEETKEDLESDDGKSRGERSRRESRTKSLSDLLATVDTPYLTPLASPTLKAQSMDAYSRHGFNPLFESFTEAELNRLRASPPPKFKFLRDAEEKLMRKLMEAAERKAQLNGGSVQDSVLKTPPNSTGVTDEKDSDSFKKVAINSKQREVQQHLPEYNSTYSQVLPLASSPSAFRVLDTKSIGQ